jgi:hypothetical protein
MAILLDQLLKKHPLLKQLGSLPGLSVLSKPSMLPTSKITSKTPMGKAINKNGITAASMFKKRYGK